MDSTKPAPKAKDAVRSKVYVSEAHYQVLKKTRQHWAQEGHSNVKVRDVLEAFVHHALKNPERLKLERVWTLNQAITRLRAGYPEIFRGYMTRKNIEIFIASIRDHLAQTENTTNPLQVGALSQRRTRSPQRKRKPGTVKEESGQAIPVAEGVANDKTESPDSEAIA